MKTKRSCLRILAIVLSILFLGVALFVFVPPIISHLALERYVNENNKNFPSLTSDGSVRTDSCALGANRVIHFHVTVLNYNSATSRSPDDLRDFFKTNMVQSIKTGAIKIEFVFYFGGSLEYDFYNANGDSVTSAVISADDFDFPWHKKS